MDGGSITIPKSKKQQKYGIHCHLPKQDKMKLLSQDTYKIATGASCPKVVQ